MTETRKYLKAAEGRAVRRPEDGAPWPAAGDWAELTLFIRRRLDDGDLVEAEPPAPEAVDPLPAAEEHDPPPPAPAPAPEGGKPAKPSK